MTPVEWAQATLKQSDAAHMKISLIPTEQLRALVAEHEETRALLARGVDDDPCDIDHNGLCQVHWLSPTPCRNAEARRLLGMDPR